MINSTVKEVQMKRIIVAAAFAMFAVPAFADRVNEGNEAWWLAPQQVQRAAPGASSPSAGASGPDPAAPYEQRQIDRGVPPYTLPHEHAVKDPVWSKDYHFIAPPM